MSESCHTYAWVMSHIPMSEVTHMNESRKWYIDQVVVHTWMSHVTHVNESCHTCEKVMTHKSSHTHMNGWYRWHDSFVCVTWLNHMCDMTPSYVTLLWLYSLMCVAWRMLESCHTYEWVMSHIWVGHVTHMNESCHTYEWVMSHIWVGHVTHMNESCHTYQ